MSNIDKYLFGTKELYEVALKSTSKMEINGNIIEKGETIALFDKIQIANFNEIKKSVSANGGFDNRAWVTWDSTQELDLYFTQGIFSKMQFALLSNSKLIIQAENSITYVPFHEVVESDEHGKVLLSYRPSANKPIFAYDDTGKKIGGDLYGQEFIPTNTQPFKEYKLDYYREYLGEASSVLVVQRLLSEFLTLEGKTRFKDDTTGQDVTGLIEIPKLKLVSNLSMILGKNANPVVPRFRAIGYPVGVKGNTYVTKITFLSDDIDSDIQ